MMSRIRNLAATSRATPALYLILVSLTLIILAMFLYPKHVSMYRQFSYDGDGLSAGLLVKSVIDTGWFFTNKYLSAPFVFNFGDYPIAESSHFFIIKLLSFFTTHYSLIINTFYILTFPLIAVSAFFVLTRLGLTSFFALPASILFAFLPDHFWRGQAHLFLAAYYAVPLYILFAYQVFREGPFLGKNKRSAIQLLAYVFTTIFLASTGIYYAFFGCFFIMIAGLVGSLNHRQWANLLNAGIFASIISFTLLANTFPNIYFQMENGPNASVGIRLPQEAEIYGLTIDRLILPLTGHKLTILRDLKHKHDVSTPLQGVGPLGTIGIIATMGFLLLIASLWVRRGLSGFYSSRLHFIGVLNIAAVLIGTVGGFGSIFAYIVSPQIRAYERISVFIAFFSLFAFFYVLQAICKKRKIHYFLQAILILSILIFALWDQVPSFRIEGWGSQSQKLQFDSDADYVKRIENILPADAAIFQLPKTSFPESGDAYKPVRLYLHSHKLRWSYAAMRDRKADIWQRAVVDMSLPQFLAALSYADFSGISINRLLYQDPEKAAYTEQQLSLLLKQKPMVSTNQELAFFDIRAYRENLKKLSPNVESNAIQKELTEKLISFQWDKGFSGLEKDGDLAWRWSDKKGRLVITNNNNEPVMAEISFKLKTGYPNYSNITLSGNLINQTFLVNNEVYTVNQKVTLLPGQNTIKFSTNAKQIPAPADSRNLFFAVLNFNMVFEKIVSPQKESRLN